MRRNLDDATRHWAQWRPFEVSLVFGDCRITWSELDRRVDRVAAGLQRLGLNAGDRLGILAANSVEWCVSALAALRVGVLIVPVNNRLAESEVEGILEDCRAAAVIVDAAHAGRLRTLVQRNPGLVVISVDAVDHSWVRPWASIDVDGVPDPVSSQEDVALIAYTSGTTGLPKGVMLTHEAVLNQAASRSIEYGWGPDTLRTLLCVPLSVVGGIVTNFLLTLVSGGRLYLERDFEPERVLSLIVDERISTMIFVPTIWETLAELPGFADADLSSVTTAITGGAPVSIPLLQRYQEKGVLIHQSYGMTETASFVADVPPRLALTHNAAAGFPAMHTRLRVVDESGRDADPGQAGEILVKTPTIMKGYWDDPAATKAAFRDGWFCTGDVGVLAPDGMISIVGRKKEVFITGGFNVYSAEVELALLRLPSVEEAVVFGVPDERWGEAGVAVVYVSSDVTPDALRAGCRDEIAAYKVPREIMIVRERLPRNLAGKISREEVKDQYFRV